MEFKLPELGEGVHEGEMVSWKVKPGDSIKDDQPLCEIMTDKATMEIPASFHGTVQELKCKPGDTVKVGQTLMVYSGAEGAVAKTAPATSASTAASTSSASSPLSKSAPAPMAASSTGERVLAAPAARKLANELGINLSQVQGTGPHGRVMKDDLLNRSSSGGAGLSGSTTSIQKSRPTSVSGGEERTPFIGLRKKISERMRQSKDTAAHFTYVEEANATELVKLRNQAKEIGAAQGVKITYLPFVMKAMVAALRQYPVLNSTLDEQKNELVYKHYYNIGLSVQTPDGLIAPVIKDVQHKTVIEIAKDIQAVVDRARNKRLTMDDLQGGTVTLTNVGSIGGLFATPIINFPEVAILGFNKIFKKPVVETINGVDQVVIRDWTYFSISLDHRIVDGAIGAEFMKTFIRYIETPSLLIMEEAF
jgi:pyruvate dehydrogenase E2 component (dihydrolipoamide acetyltransferase)